MTQRSVRVNELIKREISHVLHTRYQGESVTVTITEADISPDLRNGRIYYSVIGDDAEIRRVAKFFKRYGGEIKFHVSKQVILKYLPKFQFIYDSSMKRGTDLINLLDDIDEESQESNEPID